MQQLRRNRYEVFNLYFTSHTNNLIEGDQAQYGVLKKDSTYTLSFYLSSCVMILQIILTRGILQFYDTKSILYIYNLNKYIEYL